MKLLVFLLLTVSSLVASGTEPAPEPAAAFAGLRVAARGPAAAFRSAAPLLPAKAFAGVPPCALDPFAEAGVQARAERLEDRPCAPDDLHLQLAPQPAADDGSAFAVEVDRRLSYRIDGLVARARLGWSGAGDEAGLHSAGRALLAAGASYRLGDDGALALEVGREQADAARMRATASGTWRPVGDNLVFFELAAEPQGAVPLAGLRWWLVPQRLALEFSARRAGDGRSVQPRLALSLAQWDR